MRCQALWIGFALAMLPACGPAGTARDKFAAKYGCPADQVSVTGTWRRYAITGCQRESRYSCRSQSDSSEYTCNEQIWQVFEATDGSHAEGWIDDNDASRRAAIASATHDIPCAPGALTVVGDATPNGGSTVGIGGPKTIVEGCGQRLTYRTVPFDVPPDPRRSGQVDYGQRYTLIGRVAVPPH